VQCLYCSHYESPLITKLAEQTCTAFSDGIPDDIWWNRFDHRQPHDGDHGIQWTALGEAKFPTWAMGKGA
jgi:hypothetical protein